MEIEFSGYYDKETLQRAIALLYRPRGWGLVTRLVLLLLLGGGLAAVILDASKGETPNTFNIVAYAITALFFGLYLLEPYLTPRALALQLWRMPDIKGRQHGRIDSRGIGFARKEGMTLVLWAQIARVRRSEEAAVVQNDKGGVSILPRSFFGSERDWALLGEWLETRVKEAR